MYSRVGLDKIRAEVGPGVCLIFRVLRDAYPTHPPACLPILLFFGRQLDELGSHLSSLVQLLKVGLEGARDAFGSQDLSEAFSDGDNVDDIINHGTHLLDVHAEAIGLGSTVNTDFVKFIQDFLERYVFFL